MTFNALFFFFSIATFAPVAAGSVQPNLPFSLPVTFAGYAPCGDCGGDISVTLTLQQDNTFTERDVYRRGGSSRLSGTWLYEYASDTVTLSYGGRVRLYYRVLSARTMERLDYLGDPIPDGCVFRLRIHGVWRPCLDPV